MPTDNPEANRKYWNSQQGLVRRWLEKDKDYQKAIPALLGQHAMVHTAKLDRGGHCSFQDEVLGGLTAGQWRYLPPGGASSIIWMIWHITRIEDATMNVLLADTPQVFYSGSWPDKLGVSCENVGNDMSGEEMAALSEAMNVKALLAYRLAVGKRTRQIAQRLDPETLWAPPAPERLRRLAEDGTVRKKAAWLLDYWGGRPSTNLLLMPATRHGFVHLNEIRRRLPKLRRLPPE